MNRAVRTRLRLVVSIMLLTAAALAHASGTNVDKNTNREHHSRFSKLAFWRGHKDRNKTSGNVANVHQHKNEEHHRHISKLAFWRHHKDSDKGVKTAQSNHPSPKYAQVKAAQTKPVPRTLAAGKRGQKQARHPGGKAPAKTTPAATKAKPRQTTEGRTTASLKQ
jgi:hypothetical protein